MKIVAKWSDFISVSNQVQVKVCNPIPLKKKKRKKKKGKKMKKKKKKEKKERKKVPLLFT